LLLLLCSHPFRHVGPYLISGDVAIAVFVQHFELFFLKGHPFAFADPSVMIGIHVLEHPVDHLLHSGVPVCRRRCSSRRRRLLCLCKKETAVNHKYDANNDGNYFPSAHATFLSFTPGKISRIIRQNFAVTCKNQFIAAISARTGLHDACIEDLPMEKTAPFARRSALTVAPFPLPEA
jgi:hypothetical protein